jgi:hypothetical protein
VVRRAGSGAKPCFARRQFQGGRGAKGRGGSCSSGGKGSGGAEGVPEEEEGAHGQPLEEEGASAYVVPKEEEEEGADDVPKEEEEEEKGEEGAPKEEEGEEGVEEEEADIIAEDGTEEGVARAELVNVKVEDIRYITIIRTTNFGTHRAPSSSSVSWSSCSSLRSSSRTRSRSVSRSSGVEAPQPIPQDGWSPPRVSRQRRRR